MSPRDVVEPTLTRSDPVHGGTFDHPAYGMIGAARVSGSTTLFGSDFQHHAFVAVRIAGAALTRSLSRDWHFSRQEIVEVWLSEAQWATFVSSLNMGDGVPCTLHRVMGEPRPEIPLRREVDVAKAEGEEQIRSLAGRLREFRRLVEAETSGLSGKKREALLAPLAALERSLGASIPWVAKQFAEHMEATVEKAKVEVSAYIQSTIQRTGLAALSGGEVPRPPLELPGGHAVNPEIGDTWAGGGRE